jgi:predicted nucleic acid-binding protein
VRTIFADTSFYLALILKNDDLREAVLAFDDTSPDLRFVTSDAIFLEVLAHVSRRGTDLREAALSLIEDVRTDARATIVRMNPELFDAGLELYRRRPDKAYSLVDCMSMVICQEQDIGEVLTHDHHFEQEGLTVLL